MSGKRGRPRTLQAVPDRDEGVKWPKTVKWTVDLQPTSYVFDRIVNAVRPADKFFNLQGRLVYIKSTGVEVVGTHNLNGLLSPFVEIETFVLQRGGAVSKGYRLLPLTHSNAFLESPAVLSAFPPLNHFTRSPVFDRDWKLVSDAGYDAASGIYYDGPVIEPRPTMELLDQTLADFCWKSAADRVNFIGGLVTGVTSNHWPGSHAAVMYNANQSGAGKSTLARFMGFLLHGGCHSVSYTTNDEEFEKQLATRVSAGDRVILIDNAKHTGRVREVSSAVLERSITEPVLSYRRLGSNTLIRRPNDVIFGITMNNAKLSVDLTRRCMPINLEVQGNVRGRRFAHEDIDAFVLEHRWELLAEVVGLVKRWVEAGRPYPERPARHSVGQRWAATIDAILRHQDVRGFLDNMTEAERTFDADYDGLLELCTEGYTNGPMTAAKWVDYAIERGLLRDRLLDEVGFAKGARANATTLGLLFNRFLDTSFEIEAGTFVLACTRPQGAHGSPLYNFDRKSELSHD